MRKKLLIFALCFLAMAALPLISGQNSFVGSKTGSAAAVSSPQAVSDDSKPESTKKDPEIQNTFRILDKGSGEIVEVADREFCIGALAYEMAPGFETEALKAQTIALYTHFCRLREKNRNDPDLELQGTDFAADISNGEYYYNEKMLHEKWGSLYEKSLSKTTDAVNSVFGIVLTDENGELIDAAYHAISSGSTESSANIFGFESKWLSTKASPWDCSSPDYLSKEEFTVDEFKKVLSSVCQDADFSGDPGKYIGKISKTASGYVQEAEICRKTISGADMRNAFSLRSTAFDIEYAGNKFIFTVRGYGHGVGLSQYGADAMASQGADYREILNWYYNGAIIKENYSFE